MGHKKKHPEHENLERWLVSYADFMTLLFATFTALYALAQTDAAKLKDVGQAIKEGFAEQSIINGIKSIIEGSSAPSENPDPIASTKGAGAGIMGKFDSMTYQPGEVKSTQHMVDDLTSDLKQLNKALRQVMAKPSKERGEQQGGVADGTKTGKDSDQSSTEDKDVPLRPVEVSYQQRGVRISFDSRLLFNAGSADLRPGSEKVLDVVAKRLKAFDNRRFHVEGHTDASGIATAQFPSNWELSAARASQVVRFFIGRHQFNPASMVVVGYGSTQPIADNKTAEGRTRNRRVDIIIYNAQESLTLNPKVQFLNERPVSTKSSDAIKAPEIKPPPPPPVSRHPQPVQMSDQPVRVIIKEKDGTERVLLPTTKKVASPSESDKPIIHHEGAKASETAASKDASSSSPHKERIVLHGTSARKPLVEGRPQATEKGSPPLPGSH